MKNVLKLILIGLLATPLALKASDDIATATAATPATQAPTKPAPKPKTATTTSDKSTTATTKKTTKPTPVDSSVPTPPVQVDTRYGVFGALDKRSVYGQGAFPEPFLVDDSDGESNEARLDWTHTGGPGSQNTDYIHGEVEKGFGLLTLELESAFERDSADGEVVAGMDNVDLGARYPFYQFVSPNGDIDNTFGLGMEVGIPTHTQISHNTEVVPKIFDDLKFQNFTVQSIVGYSMLLGDGGTDGGIQNFEYGFVFGYTIDHDQLAIPGLQQLIPVVELSGARQMNKDALGTDNLVGDVGFRANLNPIGPVQPRLGIVFVFPASYAARQDQSWGIDTSLVFEY